MSSTWAWSKRTTSVVLKVGAPPWPNALVLAIVVAIDVILGVAQFLADAGTAGGAAVAGQLAQHLRQRTRETGVALGFALAVDRDLGLVEALRAGAIAFHALRRGHAVPTPASSSIIPTATPSGLPDASSILACETSRNGAAAAPARPFAPVMPAGRRCAAKITGSPHLRALPPDPCEQPDSFRSSPHRRLTYRDAGVDIDAGNEVVERIKPLVKRSFRPEVMGGLGGFGALFDLSGKYREPVLVSGTDGVGTKLKLAQQLGRHDTIGIDLVGMCVNDVLVQGAEPLFFLDYFATGKLDVDTTVAVVGGIAKGCELAGCALIGGETAEMPDMYPPGEYDLAGFTVGAVEKSQLLDGSEGARRRRAHRHRLQRPAFERLFADPPHLRARRAPGRRSIVGGVKLVDALMAPTTLYVKPILELLAQHDLHAMAHITGGGLTENIIRVIPDGLGLRHRRVGDRAAAGVRLAAARRRGGATRRCGARSTAASASCWWSRAGDVAAVGADLDRLGLAHRQIGAVVAARGSERVRIG